MPDPLPPAAPLGTPLAVDLLLAVPELAPAYLEQVASTDEEPDEATLLELLAELLDALLGSPQTAAGPDPAEGTEGTRPPSVVAHAALGCLEAALERDPDLADAVSWSFLDGLSPQLRRGLRPDFGPRLRRCDEEA
ncbi:hypothetical protein ACFFRE_08705 [Aciditerrimonas ferrireducens]|jgi:hypothetical protein|uniref:Uncharacterized protein n=1 Tax=Aciditerrimonas ferrireducens TaxID=667306 RepID=A0ABV6C3I8_9ACTN|nr:hypothetical protein [Aciditerrimonas ferrireducens]MCK4177349.1 hypothetical protein [Aciditerrimonas ferrireducens]